MDKYLNQISEGTNIFSTNLPQKPTSSEKPIIESQFINQITRGDKELIESTDMIVKPTDNIYALRAVKVRKYKLYKNKGD